MLLGAEEAETHTNNTKNGFTLPSAVIFLPITIYLHFAASKNVLSFFTTVDIDKANLSVDLPFHQSPRLRS